VPCDIRKDPRWRHGFVHRWESDHRIPLLPTVSDSHDSCDVLLECFLGRNAEKHPRRIVVDNEYNSGQQYNEEPTAVLFQSPPSDLKATAVRFLTTPQEHRPLLLHSYLPRTPFVDFVSAGLPRPLPILPLLIRKNIYSHQPGKRHPNASEFRQMLMAALNAQHY
jgi:hypothetical protein